VQVEALGPRARGLVLAASGDGLRWYVDGAPVPTDPVSGRTIWRPAAPGFYEVTVIDDQDRSARSRVRIRD
jgi:penicillin-binding protein 1C